MNIGSIKLDTLLCNDGLLRMKQLFSVSINVSQDVVSARLCSLKGTKETEVVRLPKLDFSSSVKIVMKMMGKHPLQHFVLDWQDISPAFPFSLHQPESSALLMIAGRTGLRRTLEGNM